MRVKRRLAWFPPVAILACSLGMMLLSENGLCWGVPWLCSEMSIVRDLMAMLRLVLVPPLVLVAWGVYVAAVQLRATRRAVRRLLSLPRRLPPAALAVLAHRLEVPDRLDLVACSEAAVFCHSLIDPRICMTTGLIQALSLPEVEAVLRHERHHLRRRDPLRELLWMVLDGACWWMEGGAQRARLARELAADRAVILEQGRRPLAGAVLKLLAHPRSESISADGLAISGLSVTDVRIDHLLQPNLVAPPIVVTGRWFLLPGATVVTMLLCILAMSRA